jgi:hypothetical protein
VSLEILEEIESIAGHHVVEYHLPAIKSLRDLEVAEISRRARFPIA